MSADKYPLLAAFQDPADIEAALARCESIERERRDRFAAAALTGLLANADECRDLTFGSTTRLAISYADALIAELDKP